MRKTPVEAWEELAKILAGLKANSMLFIRYCSKRNGGIPPVFS